MPVCGVRPMQNRIIQGNEATPHSWPWMCSLQVYNEHVCGCSIVTPTWIITAAHCMYVSAYVCVSISVIYRGNRGTGTPLFGLRGTVRTPTFQDVKVKNLLRRLNYSEPFSTEALLQTPLEELTTLSQMTESDENGYTSSLLSSPLASEPKGASFFF